VHRETYFVVGEVEFWKAFVRGIASPKVSVVPYVPKRRVLPARVVSVPSAWEGIESVLEDLIQRFNISTQRCLEFGVEYGYSTAALSSFFETVTGVDTFVGDRHTVGRTDIYSDTLKRLSPFPNIQLVRSDYRDWIAKDDRFYGLIHVDIVHTYRDTLRCGLWSARHAECVLFHDTLSFPTVKQAVVDIARQTGKRFYHFKESNGLGILV
jgi:Methyltransferase domain